MENLHPDILENLQEYDLEDILDALLKLHDPFLVADMVQTRTYQAISLNCSLEAQDVAFG